MTKIDIVFSFRNEAQNIEELVTRVSRVFSNSDDFSYTMIFVNDASTDGSLKLLRKLKASYPITIINMSRRFGVTPCVLEGFKASTGDAVIYMDCDLQDPPEIIPILLESFAAGADVVHTKRTSRLGESRAKMLLTNAAYRLINAFSDIDLISNVGDYKLLSRRAVNKILELPEYDPYMRGLSVWIGFNQSFVEYVRQPRFSGDTHFSLFSKGPINEFLRGLTAFSAGPLYLSFFCGVVALIFAVIISIYAVWAKISGLSAPGSAGLLIVISVMSSFLFVSNGIIGLYLAKIYYEVKSRPRSIVESVE